MVCLGHPHKNEQLTALNELMRLVLTNPEGFDVHEFSVTRTNDRKGYRDSRPFVNDSPYQEEPKTRIRIEVEVDDDANESFAAFVAKMIAIERDEIGGQDHD